MLSSDPSNRAEQPRPGRLPQILQLTSPGQPPGTTQAGRRDPRKPRCSHHENHNTPQPENQTVLVFRRVVGGGSFHENLPHPPPGTPRNRVPGSFRASQKKGWDEQKTCSPHPSCKECVGGVLLSHTLASAVPSALGSLATGFGMGPGGPSPPSPPTTHNPTHTGQENHGMPTALTHIFNNQQQPWVVASDIV